MNQLPLLEVNGLTKNFPGVKALDDINFKLYEGEVLGICGENGAGKSTLIKCLSGVYQPTSGIIKFQGNDINIKNEEMALNLGISVIYQELSIIGQLDIAQNVYLGRLPYKKTGLIDFNKLHNDTAQILKKVGLKSSTRTKVGELNISAQQMVEIGKTISKESKIIIMDEPTSSLGKDDTERLFKLIKKLKSQGCAIIYISHHMEEIFKITDRVLVLRDGKKVGLRRIGDWNVDSIVFAMVNRELSNQFPKKEFNSIDKSSAPLIEVENITNKHVKEITFSVNKGEILGIAGIVGAGRSEVLKSIFGAYHINSGTIKINGKKVNIKNPRQAIKYGIAFMSEDRKNDMLNLSANIKQNFAMPYLNHFSKNFFVNTKRIKMKVKESIEKFNIKTPSIDYPVIKLSGGNQQKVIMARIVYGKPYIYCLDEPTRGIDVSVKQEIYKEIIKIAENGCAVILVSSELPEIIGLADRVLVMRDRKIVANISKKDIKEELIMNYATGGSMI